MSGQRNADMGNARMSFEGQSSRVDSSGAEKSLTTIPRIFFRRHTRFRHEFPVDNIKLPRPALLVMHRAQIVLESGTCAVHDKAIVLRVPLFPLSLIVLGAVSLGTRIPNATGRCATLLRVVHGVSNVIKNPAKSSDGDPAIGSAHLISESHPERSRRGRKREKTPVRATDDHQCYCS